MKYCIQCDSHAFASQAELTDGLMGGKLGSCYCGSVTCYANPHVIPTDQDDQPSSEPASPKRVWDFSVPGWICVTPQDTGCRHWFRRDQVKSFAWSPHLEDGEGEANFWIMDKNAGTLLSFEGVSEEEYRAFQENVARDLRAWFETPGPTITPTDMLDSFLEFAARGREEDCGNTKYDAMKADVEARFRDFCKQNGIDPLGIG